MKYELIKTNQMLNNLETIFYNRGIMPNDIWHYINASKDDINNPLLLKNMEEGSALLVKHIRNYSKIGVLCDCDCDGFTSAALIINYLNSLFPSMVKNRLTYYFHEAKQHGLSDSVNSIIEDKNNLIIVPDAGGGDAEYVSILKEHNIDVLIIDHHDFPLESYGEAIVINNQLNGYPNKTLSGVGVVLKFCEHIDKILMIDNSSYFHDLVAVGCIADLMPLNNFETLYYIYNGLKNINNPFLKEMIKAQEFSINKHGSLDPFTIGFYIAPFINAVIRVGTLEEKQLLFEALLDEKGEELVPSGKRGHKGEPEKRSIEACRVSSVVKNRQTKIRDENLNIIEQLIKENNLLDKKIIVVQIDKEKQIDKNILGLIANILMDKYKRPVLLLNENIKEETGEIIWEGSVRNCAHSEIEDLKGFLESFDEVDYVAGHKSAFGVGILDKNFSTFLSKLDKKLENIKFEPTYKVDFILDARMNFDTEIFTTIDNLKNLWGQQFEEPYLVIENVRISQNNIQLLSKDKNPTLKITLSNGVSIMKFKSSQEEYDELCAPGLVTQIDVVGRCSINNWNGKVTPQLLVEDYNINSIIGYDF